jgi:Inhibitor of Apoptosis domain
MDTDERVRPPDEHPPDQVNTFDYEFMDRLWTFLHYLGDGDDEALAKAGWRAFKNSSMIYCELCNSSADNIDECDDALRLHYFSCPSCEFFRDFKLLKFEHLNEDDVELLARCKIT